MSIARRMFIKRASACVLGGAGCASAAHGSEKAASANPAGMGMLFDASECIGCRKCEYACNRENELNDLPLSAYEDTSVFEEQRRMDGGAFTVVNRYENPEAHDKPTYMKFQCMHCLDPACVSACLVGAFHRNTLGAVTYDAWKCMGCRYCMVACPFQVPGYEYESPLTPRVRKCTLCFDRIAGVGGKAASSEAEETNGSIPACAEMCPPQALTFGPREELLALAREKIAADPARYVDHIYGEHEAGGTSWLYLAPRSFEELGLPKVSVNAPPRLTETIQHSIFKQGIPPLLLFGLLGAAMKTFGGEEAIEGAPVKEEEVDR